MLRQNGFQVEEGVAGIPTAFIATWGTGKPVIALGSDIDGIPQSSQKPGVAYRDPMIDGAPGHGEGHNSGQAVNITAAIVLKKIMEREKIPGTIRIWPGVAEELVGTKAYYIRDGLVQGRRRRAVHACRAVTCRVSWGDGGGTGLVSVLYSFKGESAHAAGAPWRGRSALDAVELMDVGWNFRREHLPLSSRSHYVIVDGGDQPNVVPPTASVWYYFRQMTYQGIKEMWAAGDQIAAGRRDDGEHDAAADARARIGVAAALQSRDCAGHAGPTSRRSACPQWSEDDQAFARAVQKEIGVNETGPDDANRQTLAARSIRRPTRAAARTTSATFRGTCRR